MHHWPCFPSGGLPTVLGDGGTDVEAPADDERFVLRPFGVGLPLLPAGWRDRCESGRQARTQWIGGNLVVASVKAVVRPRKLLCLQCRQTALLSVENAL
mmetsp:Transcript_9202/g.25878  ORF Transcript_9202/g.25878 Transcript_9202/m.25878 type:complete len:99 (-) Transcript_9202:331-627(-)